MEMKNMTKETRKITEVDEKETKKTGTAVWMGLAVMLISASTSGCYAWVRWGLI